MENILLISKDALRKDYLSCYGSKFYHTPNIDRLAGKGTIFTNCYTAAPSTSMAVTCMFSGLNAYELERAKYVEVKAFTQSSTLFSILNDKGYETHVVWPARYAGLVQNYSQVFDLNTKVHNLAGVGRIIPRDYYQKGKSYLSEDIARPTTDVEEYHRKIVEIVNNSRYPIFIWAHLPHALKPRKCYGSDIDLFDGVVGELMGFFDGSIYLTSDHGHMNCEKNVMAYGSHVYEGAVGVPLITPRLMDREVIEQPISTIQLKNIILENEIHPQEYVYSDTRYYQQPNRKLAIRKGDFKYIYNKRGKGEELYDLSTDPHEDINLLIRDWYDPDGNVRYTLEEVYLYERWDEAEKVYMELRAEKNRVWKDGRIFTSLLVTVKDIIRVGLLAFRGVMPWRNAVRGRWGSMARIARV